VETASSSQGARSKGARTWFSTDPRSTTWLGSGDSAAAAPGKTVTASTAASTRDSPAPVAAGPPAPAAEKASKTTEEARWRRYRAPGGRAAQGERGISTRARPRNAAGTRRERTCGGGELDAQVAVGCAREGGRKCGRPSERKCTRHARLWLHGIDVDSTVKQARHAREVPAECATSRECFENLWLEHAAMQACSELVAFHIPDFDKEVWLFRHRGTTRASQGRHLSVQVLALFGRNYGPQCSLSQDCPLSRFPGCVASVTARAVVPESADAAIKTP